MPRLGYNSTSVKFTFESQSKYKTKRTLGSKYRSVMAKEVGRGVGVNFGHRKRTKVTMSIVIWFGHKRWRVRSSSKEALQNGLQLKNLFS